MCYDAVMFAALVVAVAAQVSLEPVGSVEPPAEPPKMVRRSIAATWWPVEPSVSAGFLMSGPGLLPYAGASIFAPIIPGLGPTVIARATGIDTGVATFWEVMSGLGIGWEGKLGDLRARASVVPIAVVTGVGPDTALTPGVLLPLEVGLPLGYGVSFTGSVEPGLANAVLLFDGGTLETGRDRFFVMVGAGITFGGPVD